MIETLKDNSLIIVREKLKKTILRKLASNHKLLNLKFMTLEEFTSKYFGTYDEKALYFLIKEYNLNYDIAKKILKNIYHNTPYLKKYYDVLNKNNLLIKETNFKQTINNIVVIGYDNIDKYIKKEFQKYNTKYINIYSGTHSPSVYGFTSLTSEVAFVAADIVSKLDKEDINNFYLILGDDSYNFEIKRIFELYNLPINLNNTKKIYTTATCKKFITKLEETKDIIQTLESVPHNEIYNALIDVLNKYAFTSIVDDTYINIIKEELKNKQIEMPKLNNAINVINIEDISKEGNYYILGFNQGIYPRLYHDDDLIKDEEKTKLGINTSLEKVKYEKEKLSNIFSSTPNLTVTFKEKDNYQTYYPSSLINELNLKITYNPKFNFNYSNRYNEYILALALDNLIKFNEKSPDLDFLLNNYPQINYQTYKNSFTNISFANINKFLSGKLNLSYTSINNYYLCAFKFYIKNILKLDPYKEKFAVIVGNTFHYVLSQMYNDNFNIKETYNSYLKDKELTEKEKYFMHKLYKNLVYVIDTIKEQEQNSEFTKAMTEQKIEIDISSDLSIKFIGVIDKIKYIDEKDKMLISIVDYKTGDPKISLDNINHGLCLQLPVYIYLVKNGINKNTSIAGFYLQKILPNKDIDSDFKDIKKKLRLEGYTINNENIISKFDHTYTSSKMIKGMNLTTNGFSSYTKLVNEEEIQKINDIVQNKIKEVINNIEIGNFAINPKRIDGKIIGCEHCKFKDLCYRKEEDIVNLTNTKFKDIMQKEE